MNKEELNKIIENHQHWLNKDVDGWENMKADLSGANLYYADLSYVDLSRADLSGANLCCANLSDADLRFVDLRCANLCFVDLSYADLRDADLSCANLSGADLRGADLSCANLSCANLSGANLSCANLNGVELRNADLSRTTFDEKEKIRKGIILKESMIGWKKCKDNVIVKLEIPRGATVFSINNNKCRTNKVIVKEIIGADRAYSSYIYKHLSYYVGDIIEITDFDCRYNIECSTGIHFFRTREEAERY